jgi:hypothetical protein
MNNGNEAETPGTEAPGQGTMVTTTFDLPEAS